VSATEASHGVRTVHNAAAAGGLESGFEHEVVAAEAANAAQSASMIKWAPGNALRRIVIR
jgi:hypothetical protein